MAQFTIDGKWTFRETPEIVNNNLNYMGDPHIVFSLFEMIQYIKFRDRLYEIAEQKKLMNQKNQSGKTVPGF
jgi:hypothetical protein